MNDNLKLATMIAAMAVLTAVPQSGRAHGGAANATTARPAISTEAHVFGVEGDPGKARRTIAISMDDTMRYSRPEIRVAQGETVTLVIANKGKLMHELVIGTEEELKKHAEMMLKYPTMEHAEPYMAHVRPGGTQRLTWQFTNAGTFLYGCLVAGHFEAGMKGRIVVAPRTATAAAERIFIASSHTTMSEGEVRKVDTPARKITIRHGELKNLDMPPMTMVFQVKDPAMLEQAKAGDKVRFRADKINGAYTVIEIEVVK